MKLSTKMVQPVLETMYQHRSEMVPCFIGAPGIGKTQGLYQFAKDKGVNVVTFILSNTVPSEVSGIRMPDKETKRMEVFDDMRMASLQDGDVLFLDEILEAPPMLWSACLTLIQDRIMASGRKLPDVFIVAASNQVASPGIIPTSTRDRFQFIELEFDATHWCEWFNKKYGVNPRAICPYIREDSDQYNILTPRRVTKLYTWLKDGEHHGEDWDYKIQIITSMFDAHIAELLIRMVFAKKTTQRQIKDALSEANIFVPDPPSGRDLEDMSLKDIMSYLQTRPEWDAIQATLSSVTYEDEEVSEVPF